MLSANAFADTTDFEGIHSALGGDAGAQAVDADLQLVYTPELKLVDGATGTSQIATFVPTCTWWRLTDSGTTVHGYCATNGSDWQLLGSASAMAATFDKLVVGYRADLNDSTTISLDALWRCP